MHFFNRFDIFSVILKYNLIAKYILLSLYFKRIKGCPTLAHDLANRWTDVKPSKACKAPVKIYPT